MENNSAVVEYLRVGGSRGVDLDIESGELAGLSAPKRMGFKYVLNNVTNAIRPPFGRAVDLLAWVGDSAVECGTTTLEYAKAARPWSVPMAAARALGARATLLVGAAKTCLPDAAALVRYVSLILVMVPNIARMTASLVSSGVSKFGAAIRGLQSHLTPEMEGNEIELPGGEVTMVRLDNELYQAMVSKDFVEVGGNFSITERLAAAVGGFIPAYPMLYLTRAPGLLRYTFVPQAVVLAWTMHFSVLAAVLLAFGQLAATLIYHPELFGFDEEPNRLYVIWGEKISSTDESSIVQFAATNGEWQKTKVYIAKRSATNKRRVRISHKPAAGHGLISRKWLEVASHEHALSTIRTYDELKTSWVSRSQTTGRLQNPRGALHDHACRARTAIVATIIMLANWHPQRVRKARTFHYGELATQALAKNGVETTIREGTVLQIDGANREHDSKPQGALAIIAEELGATDMMMKTACTHVGRDQAGAVAVATSLNRTILQGNRSEAERERFAKFCAILWAGRLRPLTPDEWPDPLTVLNNSRYPQPVKERLKQLWLDLENMPPDEIDKLLEEWTSYEQFMKSERVGENGKSARSITALSEPCKALTLACAAIVLEVIHESFPEMVSGMPPDAMFAHIANELGLEDALVEGDMSLYDSTQDIDLTERCIDVPVINVLFERHDRWRQIMLAVYAEPLLLAKTPIGRLLTKTYRASGQAFTYLFNTLCTIATINYAICVSGRPVRYDDDRNIAFRDGKFVVELGRAKTACVASGDDSLASSDGYSVEDAAKVIERIGFVMKYPRENGLIQSVPLKSACFLQRRYCDSGRMITDPVKFIVNFPMVPMKYIANRKNQREFEVGLLNARAMSALHNWPHCPIVAPFCESWLLQNGFRLADDNVKDVACELILDRIGGLDAWAAEAAVRNIRAARERPWPAQPADDQRHLMAQMYEIPPELQERIEATVANRIDFAWLNATLMPFAKQDWVDNSIAQNTPPDPLVQPLKNQPEVMAALNAPPGATTTLIFEPDGSAQPVKGKICRAGPRCGREGCRFIHNRQEAELCRMADHCTRKACRYQHPTKHEASASAPNTSVNEGPSTSDSKPDASIVRPGGGRKDARFKKSNISTNKGRPQRPGKDPAHPDPDRIKRRGK